MDKTLRGREISKSREITRVMAGAVTLQDTNGSDSIDALIGRDRCDRPLKIYRPLPPFSEGSLRWR